MTFLHIPWLECSFVLSLVGALYVSRLRDPNRASAAGLVFTGIVLACTMLAWLGFYFDPDASLSQWSLQTELLGREIFFIDRLSAPLVPMVALLHFLTALATARTKMRRFSFSWSLLAESIRLMTFSCKEPWILIALLIANSIPPYFELVNRRKPTRVYVLHMGLFAGLLVFGWAFVDPTQLHSTQTAWATIPVLAAILLRCGTIPVHCWVTDWFEHASFGNALLYVAPLSGVYAGVRLLLPIAPDWMLQGVGIISLVTAVYAAAMATIQRETRRFFAFLFLSHTSLVLVGLELVTSVSLTGALSLWFSVSLSLGGFGLTLRALESRFGRLALTDFHGLYDSSRALAVSFLITGLASVGFPGTLGFVSTELLVDGAVEANVFIGLGVVAATTLNGIAVVRAYLLIFTGAHHASTISLQLGIRERIAVWTLSVLILAGGIYPQPGLTSRLKAADALIAERKKLRLTDPTPAPPSESTRHD